MLGTWKTISLPTVASGTFSSDTMLLLTDGSVLLHNAYGKEWLRLTPDSSRRVLGCIRDMFGKKGTSAEDYAELGHLFGKQDRREHAQATWNRSVKRKSRIKSVVAWFRSEGVAASDLEGM
jgi:hypothetical protein